MVRIGDGEILMFLVLKKAETLLFFPVQPETPEYRAACKLWDLYIRTKNEFVQRGDYDEDDDDDDSQENPGGATEEEVRNPRSCLSFSTRLSHYFPTPHDWPSDMLWTCTNVF